MDSFSLSGTANRTEGDWEIKAPGFSLEKLWLASYGDLPCRSCRMSSDEIPIYKLPFVLKHHNWQGNIPSRASGTILMEVWQRRVSISVSTRQSFSFPDCDLERLDMTGDLLETASPSTTQFTSWRFSARSQVHGAYEVDVWLSEKNQTSNYIYHRIYISISNDILTNRVCMHSIVRKTSIFWFENKNLMKNIIYSSSCCSKPMLFRVARSAEQN